jgi:hypothetical protein
MTDLVDTIRHQVDARLDELRPLVEEASELQRAADALDGSLRSSQGGDKAGSRPARRVGKPPRGRARGDMRSAVIEYVRANPGATAGNVAEALRLNRKSVATRLAQLTRNGDLVKAARGYSAP